MDIEVILVNSFTVNELGGNPAGVVLNAQQLSDSQKLKIAQVVGFSETAFVCNDQQADYEVSFFTTTGEVDFCGHATLATFSTLHEKLNIPAGCYVQRTKAGLLAVKVEENGQITMDQQLPKKIANFTYKEIASVIGIESEILESTNLPIEVISTGLSDLIIAVPKGYLDLVNPDDTLIADFCKKHKVVGFHVFELCDPEVTVTASCRNFSPLFGISEESATGSSCGALACYLTEHLALGYDYVFEQGRAMNCRSIITASVRSKKSKIVSVKVGGFASHIGTMTVSV